VTEHTLESHAPRLDDRLFLVCGLAWGAGLIHTEAAIQHVSEYALYAAFFALLAPAQFAWGVALYRRPGRRLLWAGAGAGLLIVALWVVSRTSGLPIGPEHWTPEPVGPIDAIATADELAIALLAALLTSEHTNRLVRGCRYVATATGVCLILLSSLSLTLNSHAH